MSLSAVVNGLSMAFTVIKMIPNVITLVSALVEQAEQKNLSGTEKLAGVMSALEAFVTTISGDSGETYDQTKATLTATVNSVVALKNATSWDSTTTSTETAAAAA